MSTNDTGGPAFPKQDSVTSENNVLTVNGTDGMSLRDYFAAKAMQALLSHHGAYCDDVSRPGSVGSEYVFHVHSLAEYSYTQADAMLEARKL